ncbi:amino acid efflux transporter [Gracilibacillus orientalis]|uniref:Amino acid efflux transporter n=1 Tax=Gracilibacillus orientalis TaxID=334253 RepID=A0A1I4H493_9BACI|nr:amino acid permease [Gracilibacillus orientalis]SFL36216.1 amino acid efflux transporter [Gracilibacillus orientalis]
MEKRSIGLYEGIALYIAAILGSGVLFISAVTASIAGPASILSWVIVILINFPLAYAFACLAREYPDAGGATTFVRRSFGFHFGNMVGWFYFVTAAIGQTVVSLTGAFYVSQAFGFSDFTRIWIAFIILIFAGIANYNGVKVSGKVALILSGCLLLLLTITVLISIPSIDIGNFTPFVSNGWYSTGTAITAIFWAFFGWEAICNLANHFKTPDKNIVKSTIISVIIIGVLFLALSFVTLGTGTYGSIENDLSPIGAIMGETLGLGAEIVTAILAFFICIGTSNAFVASLTQLGYSLSRDGAFPKQLSHLHPIKQIPRRMVVFVIGFAGIGVIITEFLTMAFNEILFIPTSLGVFVYIFSMAAGVKLFKNKTLPWWSSFLSLIFCILVLPFFQLYIFVPVIVVAFYISYMIFQKWFLPFKKEHS